MGRVVDSSIFIALERRGHPPDVSHLVPAGEPVALAAISVSELLVGAHRAQSPERGQQRERFVEDLLARLPVLPFDVEVARMHARLLATLTSRGQRIGANDLQIAATALAHAFDVLTDNVRDFERVPGLTVVRPNWQS